MKKRMCKMIAALLLVTVIISLSLVTALALANADYTASLSVSRRKNMVGDEVQFTVHIENTGDEEFIGFNISNSRGGVIASYGILEVGESADIPVIKVFSAAGEFGVKFEVLGISEDEYIDVTTNTVTVTINNPPTPTPQPTPEPTPEPTQEPTQTPEVTLEPTPSKVAVLDEDTEDEQSQTPKEQTDVQSTEPVQEGSGNTVLYIVLGVVGAMLLAAAAVIVVLKRKMNTDKANREIE